jgi:hypothetical protein
VLLHLWIIGNKPIAFFFLAFKHKPEYTDMGSQVIGEGEGGRGAAVSRRHFYSLQKRCVREFHLNPFDTDFTMYLY